MFNLWVWEVDDEVEPIALLLSNLWELLLHYAQDCDAMLVDVDWVSVSMIDVRLLINGLLKVETLIHIWVD